MACDVRITKEGLFLNATDGASIQIDKSGTITLIEKGSPTVKHLNIMAVD